jgi:hypothetical protein
MKKSILLICLCSALYSFGQEFRNTTTSFNSGTITFAGGIGFDLYNRKSNNNIYNTYGASLYPSMGKFVRENLLFGVGLNMGYGYQTNQNSINDYFETTNSYSIGLSPFIRKYYPLAPGFFVFGNVSSGYRYGWSSTVVESNNFNQDGKGNTHNFSLDISPGLSFFISPKLAIESRLFGVSFYHYRMKGGIYDNKHSSTNISAGAGLGGINLSLRYFIFAE